MRKLSSIQVYAKLAQDLWVGLCGVRENAGHDDSLPFQATVFIHNGEGVPNSYQASFQKVGIVWNDGWGGPSCIQADPGNKNAKHLLEKAGDAAATHKMYWEGKPFASYDLEDILSILAESFLDIQKDHPRLKELRYYLDDEPGRHEPKGLKHFSFPAQY